MLIDRSHTAWSLVTLMLLAASTAAYTWYLWVVPGAPRGGSWPGLVFGVLGSLAIVFCGLLPIRKRLPRWRIGTAQTWLRAHLWLGLLSAPLILFHSGFRLGGALEQVLMLVFGIVLLSGVLGAVLQQLVPRVMRTTLPASAIYEQIPQVCQSLRQTADRSVVAVCGSLFSSDSAIDRGNPATTTFDPSNELRTFYLKKVRPFLEAEPPHDSPLAETAQAEALFSVQRESLPPREDTDGEDSLKETLDRLEAICHERRQLRVQSRLHAWLHLWILVHLPLSVSLLVLVVLHVMTALYY